MNMSTGVKEQMMNYAYVTAITNKDYLPGLKVLAHNLKKLKTMYPLYVLIPNDKKEVLVPELEKFSVNYLSKDYFSFSSDIESMNHYWKETFFKLHAASLTQFDKIILIDCDMLVRKNLDHLFDKNNFSACIGGSLKHAEYKDLNSGLMVLEPCDELFNQLINSIPILSGRITDRPYGDQDVFIFVAKGWREKEYLHLPNEYNLFFEELKIFSKMRSYKDIFIIHFIGKTKPWNFSYTEMIRFCLSLIKRKRGLISCAFYFKYWRLSRI